MRAAVVVGVAVLTLLPTRGADACSRAALTPHTVDSASADRTPPTLTAAPVSISREAKEQAGCDGKSVQVQHSCGDFGSILLTPTAGDDATSPAEMGFRLRVVSGSPPPSLFVPPGDTRSLGGLIPLHFGDTDPSAPFSFVLSVTAVDRAGNVSAPLPITISHPGEGGGGCAFARGLGGGTPLAAGLALLALLARRLFRRR
jgi:hypothetical protein